jgi:hypothetical protein
MPSSAARLRSTKTSSPNAKPRLAPPPPVFLNNLNPKPKPNVPRTLPRIPDLNLRVIRPPRLADRILAHSSLRVLLRMKKKLVANAKVFVDTAATPTMSLTIVRPSLLKRQRKTANNPLQNRRPMPSSWPTTTTLFVKIIRESTTPRVSRADSRT